MTLRRRNIDLTSTPQVESSGRAIKITTGGATGQVWNNCTGELSIHCAARLAREIRKALHKQRQDVLASYDSAIKYAEGSNW